MKAKPIILCTACLLSLCLGACEDKATSSATPTSGDKAAAEAPEKATEKATDKAPEKAAAPADMKVAKVEKAIAEWDKDDVKAAFEKGGWRVGSVTQSKSGELVSINIVATKGETKASLRYFRGGDDFWKKSLEKDNAVIHEEKGVLVGMVIENDQDSARALLDSLLGK